MTTIDNITDEQILQLRAEAVTVGDFEMVRICDLAMEPPITHEIAGRLSSRAECARVISEAEAQQDEQ
jgi:hypothetical protein